MKRPRVSCCLALILLSGAAWLGGAEPLLVPDSNIHTQEDALGFWETAKTSLAPVYPPLAEYLVNQYQLAEREGIGIDLGSGPGNLIIELCRRTERMHWINADINPHFFPLFLKEAEAAGVRDRVSAVFADAQALPFKDDYADILVSRGSFQFWGDKPLAFSEVYRVLKPGGVAYVGRGLSENIPVEVARGVRAKHGSGPKYDRNQTAENLKSIMQLLGIESYKVHLPQPPGSEGVNYGIWLEIRKPGDRLDKPVQPSSEEAKQGTAVHRMPPIDVESHQPRDVIAEPLSESAGLATATSLVTHEQMVRQAAKTVADGLQYVPGAWTESRGRKVKQFVSFRGQKYPYPVYAVDGIWQREFHELPYFFAVNDLERIEVVRSSAALLSGLSGMAGVINLIPRKYEQASTSAELEYGTFDAYRFHLSHGATVSDLSYAIGLGTRHTDGPEDKLAAENITNFTGSLAWQPTSRFSVQTHLFHLYGKRELQRAEPPAGRGFQEGFEAFDPTQATIASLKAHYQGSEASSTELLLSYADRRSTFVSRPEGAHTSTQEDDYEWTAQLIQSLTPLSHNALRLGVLYNHWIAPNGKRFYVGRRTDLETLSAVIVDEHTLGNWLVDAGIRWNKAYINEYGAFGINGSARGFGKVEPILDTWEPSVLNGSLGVSSSLSDKLSLHANAASGIVEPRSGTLDGAGETPQDERRVKLDVGVRLREPRLGVLSVTGFLAQQKDAIVLSGKTETVQGRTMELYQNRDQDQVGVEAEVRTRVWLEGLQAFLNATLMRSRAEAEGSMVKDEELPDFILGGGIYLSRDVFSLNLLWKYVSAYESVRFVGAPEGQAPVPQPLGDFLVWDATAAWSLGGHTQLYAEIQNVTDESFATVVGYPDSGRRFRAGLRYTFGHAPAH